MSGGASAPDPYATAAAQTASNQQTAAYNAALNRTSQYTPYGNSVYSQTGTDETGAPLYRNDITLAPEAQKQLDNQLAQNDALSNIGFGLADQAKSSLASQPTTGALNYGVSGGALQSGLNTAGVSALPNANDFADQVKQAQNASYDQAKSYLDPQYQQQQSNLDSKLANQGIMQGSEAYNRAQGDQDRARTFAYNQAQDSAIQTGNALQNQLFTQGVAGNQAGMTNAINAGNFANTAQQQAYGQAANNAALNNSAQGQNLQQQAYLNTLPLNELNALRSGTQISNPQFTTAPTSNAAGTDISGDIYKSAQINASNQNNALNGLFSLGSAALMASDRRLKRDIVRLDETPIMKLPLYAFRYLWNDVLHVGVMAQDVLAVLPTAVVVMSNGYMAVNYTAIT